MLANTHQLRTIPKMKYMVVLLVMLVLPLCLLLNVVIAQLDSMGQFYTHVDEIAEQVAVPNQ